MQTIDLFPDAEFIISQTDRFAQPTPVIPRGFSIYSIIPSWVNRNKLNFIINNIHSHYNSIYSAYLFLVLYEDFLAIFDDENFGWAISFIASIYHFNLNLTWKKLVSFAINTNIHFYNPPYYDRPSLCILSKKWLDYHGFNFNTPPPCPSLTFSNLNVPDDEFNIQLHTIKNI